MVMPRALSRQGQTVRQLWCFLVTWGLQCLYVSTAYAETALERIANFRDADIYELKHAMVDFGRGIYANKSGQDLATHYLSRLFGEITGVLQGPSDHLISLAFSIFNQGLVVFAGGLLAYSVGTSVINTSREGKVLGQRTPMYGVLIRSFTGVVMLLPKFNGYSAIQVFVMWVVLQSVHVANGIWQGVQNVVYGMPGSVVTRVAEGDQVKTHKVAATVSIMSMAKASLCLQHNILLERLQYHNDVDLYMKGMGVGARPGFHQISRYYIDKDSSQLKFLSPKSNDNYTFAECGTYRIELPAEATDDRALYYTKLDAVERTMRDLQTWARRYFVPLGATNFMLRMPPCDTSTCRVGSDLYRVAMSYYGYMHAGYKDYVDRVSATGADDGEAPSDRISEAARNIHSINGGWLVAGSMYEDLITGGSRPPPALPSPSAFYDLAGMVAPVDHLNRFYALFDTGGAVNAQVTAELDRAAMTAATHITARTDSRMSSLLEAFRSSGDLAVISTESQALRDGPNGVRQRVAEAAYHMTPERVRDPETLTDPNYYTNETRIRSMISQQNARRRNLGDAAACAGIPFAGKCSQENQRHDMLTGMFNMGTWLPLGEADLRTKWISEDTEIFLVQSVWAWNGLLMRPAEENPIFSIRQFGNRLLEASINYASNAVQDMLFAGMTAAIYYAQVQAKWMGLKKIMDTVSDVLFKAGVIIDPLVIFGVPVGQIIHAIVWVIGVILKGLGGYFQALGFSASLSMMIEMFYKFMWVPVVLSAALLVFSFACVLAIYIPIVPFFMFTLACVTWFLGVIEAMLAAPLVALGLAHPQGHDFLGKSEQAVVLLLSVFSRPIAILMGFVIGIMMAYASLWLTNNVIMFAFHSSLNQMLLYDSIPGRYVSVLLSLFLYSYIVLAVVDQCFSMVYKLPHQLIKWIDPRLAQQPDEIQILAEAKNSFSQDAQGAGQGMSGTVGAQRGRASRIASLQ